MVNSEQIEYMEVRALNLTEHRIYRIVAKVGKRDFTIVERNTLEEAKARLSEISAHINNLERKAVVKLANESVQIVGDVYARCIS